MSRFLSLLKNSRINLCFEFTVIFAQIVDVSFRLIRNRVQQVAIIAFIITLVVCLVLAFFKVAFYITAPFLMVWIMVWLLGSMSERKNTDDKDAE